MKLRFALAAFALVGMYAFAAVHVTAQSDAKPLAFEALTGGYLSAQNSTMTTKDGVYSEPQAQRGQAVYAAKCAICHGLDGHAVRLPGVANNLQPRDLVGQSFITDWTSLTLGQLSDRIRTSMPQDDPASLTRAQVADIIAYVLQMNGFPAGPAALPSEQVVLGSVNFVAP